LVETHVVIPQLPSIDVAKSKQNHHYHHHHHLPQTLLDTSTTKLLESLHGRSQIHRRPVETFVKTQRLPMSMTTSQTKNSHPTNPPPNLSQPPHSADPITLAEPPNASDPLIVE
jgi:hypothetical protein